MNCTFCSQHMSPDQWGDLRCGNCEVLFSTHPEHGEQIIFIRYINNKKYCLNLFPRKTMTILVTVNIGYNIKGEYLHDYQEMVLPYNVSNVTPQNAADKIKTILVFS